MNCTRISCRAPDCGITESILNALPSVYSEAYSALSKSDKESLTEIRVRSDKPCSFTSGSKNIVITDEKGRVVRSSVEEIADIIERLCDGSVYSYEEQIRDGFIPFCGTRVGVCGTGICVEGVYKGQRRISSLSFRIPSLIRDAADLFCEYITQNGFENTMGVLAVSPPNCGKTTFLRALANRISDTGIKGFGKRVCLIDERGELYNRRLMSSSLCDVISGVPKIRAVEMAIRSMSPQVIVLDEIGNEEETELLCKAFSGGVYIAASVHGNGISDVMYCKGIRDAVSKGVFSTVYLMRDNAAVFPGEIIDIAGEARK